MAILVQLPAKEHNSLPVDAQAAVFALGVSSTSVHVTDGVMRRFRVHRVPSFHCLAVTFNSFINASATAKNLYVWVRRSLYSLSYTSIHSISVRNSTKRSNFDCTFAMNKKLIDTITERGEYRILYYKILNYYKLIASIFLFYRSTL